MSKILKLNLYCIFYLSFMFSVKQSVASCIDSPEIKAGTAKLTGTITSRRNANKVFVYVIVPHSITGEFAKYKALVDQSGKFSLEVEVETNNSFVRLSTSLNEELPVLVKLKSGVNTQLNIVYNNDDIVKMTISPAMNEYDMAKCFEVMAKMTSYRPNRVPQPLYDKNTDYFLSYAKSIASERWEIFLKNDTLLSKELNGILAKELGLFLYKNHVFDYRGEMERNYRNTNKGSAATPVIQQIDRTYFRFLSDFKLNDPQYLYAFTFLEFQKTILQNEILALPEIGDSDIASWLAKAKAIMADLVGFDTGLYYDILAANAYGRQLTEELRPLSDKQKYNISKYWKNGEIAKLLFRKSKKVSELSKIKSQAVVKEVSSVAPEKVLETILVQHKGKVVLIDMWATWCVPCLNAMQEFRSTKGTFLNKDVVFVYLTNPSSPKKLWEEKIKGIGSEHYYLTGPQWEYIMTHFGFEYIPSYLLYNKQGLLVNKFNTFPGSEEVKTMIDKAL